MQAWLWWSDVGKNVVVPCAQASKTSSSSSVVENIALFQCIVNVLLIIITI